MQYRLHQWIDNQEKNLQMDQYVSRLQDWFQDKTDQDMIELLMTAFIKDEYPDNKIEEKIFTKMVEVLIAECMSRIGFESTTLKRKNEVEDVRITKRNQTILIDAKTYRLGRSQIAPNVKDFVKLHTFEKWIANYNSGHSEDAIGGLIVYPSTHEWQKQSQVYKECSNKKMPIVMLPFEVICFLLQEKDRFNPEDLFELWNYQILFQNPVSDRISYWITMFTAISNAIHIGLNEMLSELDVLKLYYEEAVKESQLALQSKVNNLVHELPERVNKMNEYEVRQMLIELLIDTETSSLIQSSDNISKNRRKILTYALPIPIEENQVA